MMWIIEYGGMPPCWINREAPIGEPPARGIDVTFRRRHARVFNSLEEAKQEILRLGLPDTWNAVKLKLWRETK